MRAGLESFLTEEAFDLGDWREEVRRYVRDKLPAALACRAELRLKLHQVNDIQWQKVHYAKDWFAGAWPKGFGGQDWDLQRQLIFTQQSAIDHAPMMITIPSTVPRCGRPKRIEATKCIAWFAPAAMPNLSRGCHFC